MRDGRGPHARAVRGRSIDGTKVEALPESLGQCTRLEGLCVPRPPPRRRARLRRCAAARGAAALDAAAAALPVRGRGPRAHVWRERPTGARPGRAGAARRGRTVASRYAYNSELAALPAAVEWPKLKTL